MAMPSINEIRKGWISVLERLEKLEREAVKAKAAEKKAKK